MPTERTDPELMAAFQQGDAGAFEELVGRHHRGLINFFYHHSRDRQLAEDWAQEVFLRVVHHAPGYVPRARFTTFLYRIARNLWIDVIRERAVHKRPASLDARDEEGERREEWVPSAATRQPADALASEEVGAQVRRVVDQLPADLRDVVALSELQGLKYAEIGEILGIPVGTVKSRMHTAVQRLRVMLAPLADGAAGGAAPPAAGPEPAGERGAPGAALPALLLAAAALAGARLAASPAPEPAPSAAPDAPAEEPVDGLLARLAHEDWAERDAAVKALVARGASAVPALAAFIAGAADADAALRAGDALRQIGWPALADLMNRPDAPPRLAAAREACVRAFLEGAIAKQSLKENTWSEGPARDADPDRLEGTWETGSGHGFTLRLYRFRREGASLRLDRLSYGPDRSPYATPFPPERYPVKVETAVAPAATARAAFALALRASALRLEPKTDDEDPSRGFGSRWGSTGDFHSLVRLEQGGRVVYAGSYTGYPGSQHEQAYVAVDACSVVFAAAFRGLAWSERAADDADRSVLLERSGGFGEDAWWVRERLLVMVGALGDRRFEPFLKKVIGLPLDETKRPHYHAINAFARISGVELRTRPVEAMDVAAVRAAYLDRFAGGVPAPEPENR